MPTPAMLFLCAWVLWGQVPPAALQPWQRATLMQDPTRAFETHSAYPTEMACERARIDLEPKLRYRRAEDGPILSRPKDGYDRLLCLPDTVRPQ